MHERSDPANFLRIGKDVRLGRDVSVHCFVNLYGCSIGDESRVGAFVEIQKNAQVGARCKISSHTFICEGVIIEDDCFIGHHVCFINDRYPRATSSGAASAKLWMSYGHPCSRSTAGPSDGPASTWPTSS